MSEEEFYVPYLQSSKLTVFKLSFNQRVERLAIIHQVGRVIPFNEHLKQDVNGYTKKLSL